MSEELASLRTEIAEHKEHIQRLKLAVEYLITKSGAWPEVSRLLAEHTLVEDDEEEEEEHREWNGNAPTRLTPEEYWDELDEIYSRENENETASMADSLPCYDPDELY